VVDWIRAAQFTWLKEKLQINTTHQTGLHLKAQSIGTSEIRISDILQYHKNQKLLVRVVSLLSDSKCRIISGVVDVRP